MPVGIHPQLLMVDACDPIAVHGHGWWEARRSEPIAVIRIRRESHVRRDFGNICCTLP
jgi:hypothetical protein